MKKINRIFLLIIFFLHDIAFSQTPGEWTWMHGDNLNPTAIYGTKGVASATNKPPAQYEAIQWRDNNGIFWLYGGTYLAYDDLWKFNPVTNQWTWVKGSGGVLNQPPVYGTQGVPSPVNSPGCRSFGAATWTDNSGNLWLFGGTKLGGGFGKKNDLWKYNISTNEWTWMKGTQNINDPGSYGTKGLAATTNNPAYRDEINATWTDNTGNLWMFGGNTKNYGNDLWKYNIATNKWTWMNGAIPSIFTTPGVYGTKGIPNSSNCPGGRMIYSSWTDASGNLWLFGGKGYDIGSTAGCLNDLWKYDITNNMWTWMSGSKLINSKGNYGTECFSATSNEPPARFENRACWTDSCGNFWMFGGTDDSSHVFNDLWHYSVASKNWSWVSGSKISNQTGIYGIKGLSAPANIPGCRMGSLGWIDLQGNLWLFGGIGFNDMWRYVPDFSCKGCKQPCSFSADAGNNVSLTKGDTTQLSASQGTSYSWSPATGLSCTTCKNPKASPTISTTYYLTVKNNGCSAIDSVNILVNEIGLQIKCEDFFIPTAFSPNGNGENDLFCLYGTNCIETFQFTIYDRWGEKVFEVGGTPLLLGGAGGGLCWDGFYKNKELDASVFAYHLNVVFKNKETGSRKGNITLVR